jgi:hypothetical protein
MYTFFFILSIIVIFAPLLVCFTRCDVLFDKPGFAIGCMVLGFIMLVVTGVNYDADKEKKLQSELLSAGCEEMTREETGRRVHCGKACSRPEIVIRYQCTNGVRMVFK